MKRSPAYHLGLGLMVVSIAFLSGVISRRPHHRHYRVSATYSASLQTSSPYALSNLRERGLIVRYKAATPQSLIDNLRSRLHVTNVLKFDAIDPQLDFEQVPPGMSLNEAMRVYRNNPNVDDVEENTLYQEDVVASALKNPLVPIPNDPGFGSQWGLSNNGQEVKGQTGEEGADIGAREAWAITKGSEDVVVAVLDSGIDYNHVDLKENIWTNKGGTGASDEDDGEPANNNHSFIHGFNAVEMNGDPMDEDNHGTHCAGIIGAAGGNGEGVVGVNWHVKLMPVKFIGSGGAGTLEDAIEGINFIIKMKKSGANVRVINASWGSRMYSDALREAIAAAGREGILFVAAAGNSRANNDSDPHYPSNYDLDNVISVAALDNTDHLASFSNYGAKTVHIAAPGKDIYSTLIKNHYDFMSGTSMAAPYVSGVAALIVAHDPDISVKDLKERLMKSVVPVPELKGKVASGGRLHAGQALRNN